MCYDTRIRLDTLPWRDGGAGRPNPKKVEEDDDVTEAKVFLA